jgi:hypothetical protein
VIAEEREKDRKDLLSEVVPESDYDERHPHPQEKMNH